MSAITYLKLKREIKKEILKEFIVPLLEDIKDPEGEYRSDCVKEILNAAKEETIHKYSPKTFLKLIS